MQLSGFVKPTSRRHSTRLAGIDPDSADINIGPFEPNLTLASFTRDSSMQSGMGTTENSSRGYPKVDW